MASHKLVLQFRELNRDQMKAYVPLVHLPGSAVIAWPVRIMQIPDQRSEYLEFYDDLVKPCLLSVFDLKDDSCVTAACFSWKSPISQAMDHAKHGLAEGIRAFLCTKFLPVKELAAMHAFWTLSATQLTNFATYFGLNVPPGEGLFGLLFSMVAECLGCNDTKALQIVARRLGSYEQQLQFGEELLALDEALDVFEFHDQKTIISEQKDVKSTDTDRKVFLTSFKVKARAMHEAAAGGESQAKRARMAAPPPQLPLPPVSAFTIEHAVAKELIPPPPASIWRAHKKGEWWGHTHPDLARCREPWVRHGGERPALIALLRKMGQQYAERNNLGRDVKELCHVKNLFAHSG